MRPMDAIKAVLLVVQLAVAVVETVRDFRRM
jgi:hypothetical protein